MNQEFYDIIDEICGIDSRYKSDAYEFVMEALAYSQKKFHRQKHVNGEELLLGIKDLLIDKFGPMARQVLNYWGVESTEDFGNIVFNLVDRQILSKDKNDHIESFRNAYDFKEVFERGYRKLLEKRISRMRSAK